MKIKTHLCRCCLGAVLLFNSVGSAKADVAVTVNPAATWLGYMNVFNLPADGGAYMFGSGWGTADLNASFSGAILTLAPNTSISRDVPLSDAYWWKPDGSGNKNMAASMYVQDDALAGQTINFSGIVLANSLQSPYATTIFIKDFVPDYSSFTLSSAPATPGAFNLNLTTAAGHHIQYGFETVGPNAPLGNALGSVQLTAVPEPTAIVLGSLGFIGLLIRRHIRL